MKSVARLLILFICFITIQSDAQRGGRLFDQFGYIEAIHEDQDGILWVGGMEEGLWYYDDSGWELVAGFTDQVYAIHESSDGTLWVGSSSVYCKA